MATSFPPTTPSADADRGVVLYDRRSKDYAAFAPGMQLIGYYATHAAGEAAINTWHYDRLTRGADARAE